MLTDSVGAVTDSNYYTAFGEDLYTSGSTPHDFKYVGEQADANAGFYYLIRARWMDPAIGRFASVDPEEGCINCPITQHRYLYSEQSPISKIDPSGRMSFSIGELLDGISANGILQRNERVSKVNETRKFFVQMCGAAAKFAKAGNNAYDEVRKVTGGTLLQSHHVFQDAEMLQMFSSYESGLGFAIPLLGRNGASPHGMASAAQRKLKGKDLGLIAYEALIAAGCRSSDATEITLAAQRYNELMGWVP